MLPAVGPVWMGSCTCVPAPGPVSFPRFCLLVRIKAQLAFAQHLLRAWHCSEGPACTGSSPNTPVRGRAAQLLYMPCLEASPSSVICWLAVISGRSSVGPPMGPSRFGQLTLSLAPSCSPGLTAPLPWLLRPGTHGSPLPPALGAALSGRVPTPRVPTSARPTPWATPVIAVA